MNVSITMSSMNVWGLIYMSIIEAGFRYSESVGLSEMLVVGDVVGDSEKIRKAKRLGVRVVSVYELITIGISKKAES